MSTVVTPNSTVPTATQDILTDLWRRRLDTLITGVANGDPYYLQIANAAEHISAEHQGRFLIELIQNANDQAVRDRQADTFVSITRTDQLIAVGNRGEPFDSSKVDNITSIFKSDKTADVCIGNKGIGFKAVFQIADSAEIFSSAAGGSLVDGASITFRMVRRPFDDAGFASQLRHQAERLLRRDTDRRKEIEKRFPKEPAIAVVMREAGRAAGFTFPLPLTEGQFRQRVEQLRLTKEVLASTQTLIILPLSDATVAERVSQAIDEVQGGAPELPPAVSFLFLPGIDRIDVLDLVRGFRSELRRTETTPLEQLGNGVVLRRQKTMSARFALTDPGRGPETRSQDWWVTERSVGGREKDDEEALRERQALREAIQALHLPEENWKDVDHVPVGVALPLPSPGGAKPLGADGRFCIGLPTLVRTGVPLWVNAHFHGKIDRTAIEFKNKYNTLLFEASQALAGSLIERLKRESGKDMGMSRA